MFLMKIYDITIPLLLIIIVNIITLVIIKTQSIAQVFSYIVKASKFIDTYIVIKQVEFALINPGFHPVLLLILWFLQMFKITSTLASVSKLSESKHQQNKQTEEILSTHRKYFFQPSKSRKGLHKNHFATHICMISLRN